MGRIAFVNKAASQHCLKKKSIGSLTQPIWLYDYQVRMTSDIISDQVIWSKRLSQMYACAVHCRLPFRTYLHECVEIWIVMKLWWSTAIRPIFFIACTCMFTPRVQNPSEENNKKSTKKMRAAWDCEGMGFMRVVCLSLTTVAILQQLFNLFVCMCLCVCLCACARCGRGIEFSLRFSCPLSQRKPCNRQTCYV